MTNDYENYEDYWNEVQRSAKIELEEMEEHIEREGIEEPLEYHVMSMAERAANHDELPNYYQRTVIFHTDQGFNGDGHERYINHRDFGHDSNQMINALAQAAYFNDVQSALEMALEFREDLDEAMMLLKNNWSIDVESSYEYVRDTMDGKEVYEFKFKNLCNGGGEWRMYDHNGDGFEVISPDVHLKQDEYYVFPEQSLKIWLDNICARRLRELDDD